MQWIKNLFKKKQSPMTEHEIYAYMGSVGVSPKHMKMFQESMNEIKKFQSI